MRPHPRIVLASVTALLAATVAVVELGGAASAATATSFGAGTPGFVNSAAPPTQADGTFFQSDNAGEPSLGTDWKSGAAMYMAGTDTYRLTFDNAQTPPAVTWTDVSSPYSIFNLDPILATDHQTGTTLAGGDNGACAVMSLTTTDGGYLDSNSWSPSTPCPFTADHPTVGMGPFAGGPPLGSSGSFVTYFCQQSDLDHCSHSIDGGKTWLPSVPTTACAGLHGHVKVSADGTAYLPSVNCVDAGGNLVVGAMTSSDNGTTWGGYGIAGATEPSRGFDPSIATTPDNTVYETWSRDGDFHPVVAVSTTHGQSWSAPVDLTAGTPIKAGTFEAAVGGDNGRAAVAFLGTTTETAGLTPFDNGYDGTWYLYVAYTYDGGATWQTVQATPDPVQRGQIDDSGTTASGQRNLLDFIDANVTKDGRVVVAYADGCVGSCNTSGTPASSNDAWASVAYQSVGEGLFAASDTAPAAAAPALVKAGLKGRLH